MHYQKLKICLLSYRSNPYSGGQGIYVKFLSKALVEMGHEVDVMSSEPYPELDSRVKLIKIPGLNLFGKKNHVTAIRAKNLLSFTDFFEWFSMLTGGFPEPYTFGRRILKYFKKNTPCYDVIHDNQSLSFAILKLQEIGWPLITTIHHPISTDLKIAIEHEPRWQYRLLINRWHSFLKMQKKVAAQLNHVVTVSESSKKDIGSDFNVPLENITVVHNGIDTEIFSPQPKTPRAPYTVVATASADAPLKGLDYLLKAIAELKNEFPTIQLNVIGKINEDGASSRLIKELDLKDHVNFFSDLETNEIVSLYASATCAVVPSIYEGFGLPAAEAMACKVPVVSTDGGALPEVVGSAGLLVPARNKAALKDAISKFLHHPELRTEYAEKGRQRIVDNFSWQECAKQMEDLYRNVIQTADRNHVSRNY